LEGEALKFSFGIIVLNGEPFTRYCIRALYPHAHQIIVSEGACYGAESISSPEGHSTDGTLDVLRRIKETEDPENKITIVTAEDEGHPDGFWPGEKHEQSQAYAKRATGDYLWQIDIDEFYKDKDIEKVREILSADRGITAVSFRQIQFWGGIDHIVDSWYLRRGMNEFHRLFRWGKGYSYSTHRPPTVLNEKGTDTRKIKWLNKDIMSAHKIYLYHYSFVFPKQVKEKALYYKNAAWSKRKDAEWWANDVYMKLSNPYRVFSIYWVPGWLEKFRMSHPAMILRMMEDIRTGVVKEEIRATEDIEKLVSSFRYNAGITWLKFLDPVDLYYHSLRGFVKRNLKMLLHLNKK
jgi:hypothetical protein